VTAVAVGARGLAPLLAFALGGFAAGAAVRQLVLAARAARRTGTSRWRAVTGRANGGMVVHLGVVVVAVALAASSSYATGEEVRLEEGGSATVVGHRVTYLGSSVDVTERKTVTRARVEVDGEVHEPALNQFPNATQTIGSPSVRWGLDEDVYLTLVAAPSAQGEPAVVGVLVEPLASWLWIGGGVMAVGTVLAAWPGPRRRRPTDATSVPLPMPRDVRDPEPAPVA
jgi:cytochrome c-type biogenesis protein CcmF